MVSFKKQGDESNASESIVDAGTYDVYVEITGNIATKAPVKIGTAVIDSYETKAADFTVTGQEGTYDIYVSYEEENSNCTKLDATKTDAQVVIAKKTVTPTVDQYVVNKDDSNAEEYSIEELVKGWTLDDVDKSIQASLAINETEASYFAEEDGLSYSDGKISIKLNTTATNKLEKNTSATIHVNLGKSFNNYQVAFDISVVITTQKVVGIEVVDGTDLTYDGNAKELKYTSSKKSVATVSKSGKITAKGKGTVTIKAKVILKNGSTKTVKMTVKVK